MVCAIGIYGTRSPTSTSTTDCLLTRIQGTSCLLSSSEFVSFFPSKWRSKGSGVFRCLHSHLGWRSGRGPTDQAAGRQHVSVYMELHSWAPSTDLSRSFMQSVSILGYTIFPLVIASVLSAVKLFTIARIPIYIVLVAWSLAAGVSILGGSGVVKNRVALAIYPMFLFYVAIGCLCFIS
jgi:hypothetical protein